MMSNPAKPQLSYVLRDGALCAVKEREGEHVTTHCGRYARGMPASPQQERRLAKCRACTKRLKDPARLLEAPAPTPPRVVLLGRSHWRMGIVHQGTKKPTT